MRSETFETERSCPLAAGRGPIYGLFGGVQRLDRRALYCCGPVWPLCGNAATEEDLVDRQFTVADLDWLWLTDITEHPTPSGSCAAQPS
jgi:hypothetical protein